MTTAKPTLYKLETAEDARHMRDCLKVVVMPWDNNTRKNGLGETLATVSHNLGGFSNWPYEDDDVPLYGYMAGGQGSILMGGLGACIHGNTPDEDEAKRRIDNFIRKERPDMVFIGPEEPKEPRYQLDEIEAAIAAEKDAAERAFNAGSEYTPGLNLDMAEWMLETFRIAVIGS